MKRCVYIRPWFLSPFFLIVAVVALVPASVSAPPQNTQVKSGTLTQVAKTIAERLGYPANSRLLIIHADDVGMMRSVNRASFEALEKGWVTSASILVVCPWFPEVTRFARAHPDADLGIHLALNSEWTSFRWGPVSHGTLVPSLLDDEGYLPLVEETVLAKARPKEAERELRSQIDRALAAGIRITHLDA